MREIIIIVDVLAALGLVTLVLLQQGKGADMGAAFGSGASQTLFGSRGTANFLTRATAVLAVVFFLSNLGLAYLAKGHAQPSSVTTVPATQTPAVPEVPVTPATPSVPEVPK
ncbi:MAG: preprotein translocase subunit SecG [Gammaproteobacteria bacterium]|nr:preprotein translocase subunit SecG [Gammaproteobacteria bacterium]